NDALEFINTIAVKDAKIEQLLNENVNLTNLLRWKPDAILRARFTDISELSDTILYSNPIKVAGMD
ncbi:hypothetical protein PENTCL1PPCAC_20215, partial [Pristionchus entomophagus]